MVSKEDWSAAMSSEIFREYVKQASVLAEPTSEITEERIMVDFHNFERKIRSNPHFKQVFKILQNKLASDSKFRAKTNPSFAECVMLLDLDEPV